MRRGNVWVGVVVMRVMLGAMVVAFLVPWVNVAGPGPRLSVRKRLFLTAVFFLCHLRNAEQLLVVGDLRGQLKDPLKNLLITVWRLQLA